MTSRKEYNEKLERMRARAAKSKPNRLIDKIMERAEKKLGDTGTSYEYRRTCSQCGAVRFAPAELVEAKPKKIPHARNYVGKRYQVRRTEQTIVASHNAMLAEANRCGSCGSSAFTDERVTL